MPRTQITGSLIKDGTVAGADMATATPGYILVADGSGVMSPVPMTGDASISNTGVVTVGGGGDPSFKRVTSRSATATLTVNDSGLIVVDATSASIVLTLPAAPDVSGYTYTFVKIDNTTNTLTVSSASLLSGATTTLLLTQYQSLTVKSNGITWYVIASGIANSAIAGTQQMTVYNQSSGLFETVARNPILLYHNGAAKNINLSSDGVSDGVLIPRNSILKAFWAVAAANVSVNALFQVRKNGLLTNLATITMPTGTRKITVENINITYNTNDELNVFLSSTANVTNVQCWAEFAWIS